MAGILMPFNGLPGHGAQVLNPYQLSSLTLWYNASSNQTNVNGTLTNDFQSNPLTDGTQVTKWKDLSGVGADANIYAAGGGNGPLYKTNIQNGLSALLYSSVSKSNLDINPIGAWAKLQTGFSMYVICRPTSLPGNVIPIAVTDFNLGHQWNGTYWQVGAAGGLATAQSTTISTSNWAMHGMIFDGGFTDATTSIQNAGRLKYRFNKAPQTLTFSSDVGTTTSNSATVLYVGGNNRNIPKFYLDGYIGELMIWQHALTTYEINGVEKYISDKWGI